MAKDMSCARVKQCSAASIGATERHNERLNTDYANVNVPISTTDAGFVVFS